MKNIFCDKYNFSFKIYFMILCFICPFYLQFLFCYPNTITIITGIILSAICGYFSFINKETYEEFVKQQSKLQGHNKVSDEIIEKMKEESKQKVKYGN